MKKEVLHTRWLYSYGVRQKKERRNEKNYLVHGLSEAACRGWAYPLGGGCETFHSRTWGFFPCHLASRLVTSHAMRWRDECEIARAAGCDYRAVRRHVRAYPEEPQGQTWPMALAIRSAWIDWLTEQGEPGVDELDPAPMGGHHD